KKPELNASAARPKNTTLSRTALRCFPPVMAATLVERIPQLAHRQHDICHYFKVPHTMSPAEAWKALQEGNTRFVSGEALQPNQGLDRREEVSASQNPHTVLFGCSDSRLAAEIIFDQGLGDMFVVRTAGQVVDPTVLGSIEFAVELLEVPLIVVLVHSNCGAIGATENAWRTGELPDGFIRTVVDRIMPTIARVHVGRDNEEITDEMLRRAHVSATVQTLQSYSRV